MALVFEYEKTLSTGTNSFISHEPNSVLYNYYTEGNFALDKNASINNGNYEDINFSEVQRHLTTKAVARIGIKNFPGIGGIGFYKDLYSDESKILAPIHAPIKFYLAPVLNKIEIVNGKLHIVINPTDFIKYTCYRIVVRQNAFAFEYITYNKECYVDPPTVKGDYIAYCIGYDEDNGTYSENSNELPLTILTGTDDWSPAFDGNVVADVADLIDRTEVLENHVIGTPGTNIPFNVNSYSIFSGDESATTEASVSIDATGNENIILAFVVTRSTPTFPDDWEIVQQFTPTYYDTDTTKQTLTILKKKPVNGTETFTLNTAEPGRIYVTLLNVDGVGKMDIYENIYNTTAEGITSTDAQYINKLGTIALYVYQAIYVTTGQTMSITPSDDCLVIPCGSRLFIIVDTSAIIKHSLTFSVTNKGTQLLSLNIQEAMSADGLLSRTDKLEEAVEVIETKLDTII